MRCSCRVVARTALPLLVAACGGGGGSSSSGTTLPSSPSPVLTTVTVTAPGGGSSSLVPGQTLQLVAAPKDQSGNALSATIGWSTSAPGVVTVSTAGLVTAVAPGSATITATATAGATTVAATVVVTVVAPPALTSVTIAAPSPNVVVGGTMQLSATAMDRNGAPFAATLSWASSNAARATVNANGLVTGVAGGPVTITVQATSGGTVVSDATAVNVQALTSVAISGGASVTAGQTLQLAASPKDQNGNTIASATVAWSSNATSIATVNATSGLVTGVSAGAAGITALATLGSATASAVQTITVAAGSAFPLAATVNAVGLSFQPRQVDISVGGTVTWNGLSSHDVTWDTGGVPGGDIAGAPSGSRTFSVPAGSYAYHCSIHGSGMSGIVIVH